MYDVKINTYQYLLRPISITWWASIMLAVFFRHTPLLSALFTVKGDIIPSLCRAFTVAKNRQSGLLHEMIGRVTEKGTSFYAVFQLK